MLGEMLLKAKIEKTSLNLGMCVLVSLLLWNSEFLGAAPGVAVTGML